MTKPVDSAEALARMTLAAILDKNGYTTRADWIRSKQSGDVPGEEAVAAMLAHSAALVAENERLREALEDARLQLEYLNERSPTGTTPAILARVRTALETRNG